MVRKDDDSKYDNSKKMGSIFFRHEVKDFNRKNGKEEEYTKELIIDGIKGLSISFTENNKGKYNGKYVKENVEKGVFEVIVRKDDKEDKMELSPSDFKKFVKKELKFADEYVNKLRGKFSGGGNLTLNASATGQCGGSDQCGGGKSSSKKSSKKSSKSSRKLSKKSSKKMSGGCNCAMNGGASCSKCNKPKKSSRKSSSKKSSSRKSSKSSSRKMSGGCNCAMNGGASCAKCNKPKKSSKKSRKSSRK